MTTLILEKLTDEYLTFDVSWQNVSYGKITYFYHTHVLNENILNKTAIPYDPIAIFNEWLAHQGPYIQCMYTYMQTSDLEKVFIHVLVQHSLRHPEWYTHDFWEQYPIVIPPALMLDIPWNTLLAKNPDDNNLSTELPLYQ